MNPAPTAPDRAAGPLPGYEDRTHAAGPLPEYRPGPEGNGPGPTGNEPRTRRVPAAPLPPARGGGRGLRTVLVVLAICLVLLAAGGLISASIAQSIERQRYGTVSATQELGTPADLRITTDVGDVTVRTSGEADEVSLSLENRDGSPQDDARANVDIDQGTGEDATTSVEIRQPAFSGPIPFLNDEIRDVVVTVPEDLAADMSLDLNSSVGEVDVQDGAYASLTADTDTGSIYLDGVDVAGPLSVSTDVGDIDVRLDPDASTAPERIDLTSSVGSIEMRAPCCTEYQIDARSNTGEVDVDDALRGSDGPELTARTDVGEITIGH